MLKANAMKGPGRLPHVELTPLDYACSVQGVASFDAVRAKYVWHENCCFLAPFKMFENLKPVGDRITKGRYLTSNLRPWITLAAFGASVI